MEGSGSSHSETQASDRSRNPLHEAQAHQGSGGLHSDAHTRDKADDPPSEDSPMERAQSHQSAPGDNGPPTKNTDATTHRLTAKAMLLHSAVRELNIKAAQPQSSVTTATQTYLIALTELVPQEHLDSIFINAPPNPRHQQLQTSGEQYNTCEPCPQPISPPYSLR